MVNITIMLLNIWIDFHSANNKLMTFEQKQFFFAKIKGEMWCFQCMSIYSWHSTEYLIMCNIQTEPWCLHLNFFDMRQTSRLQPHATNEKKNFTKSLNQNCRIKPSATSSPITGTPKKQQKKNESTEPAGAHPDQSRRARSSVVALLFRLSFASASALNIWSTGLFCYSFLACSLLPASS